MNKNKFKNQPLQPTTKWVFFELDLLHKKNCVFEVILWLIWVASLGCTSIILTPSEVNIFTNNVAASGEQHMEDTEEHTETDEDHEGLMELDDETASIADAFISDGLIIHAQSTMWIFMVNDEAPCVQRYEYQDRTVRAYGDCKDNRKNGVWTLYFPNGAVLAQGMIHNGFMVGRWIYYYSNGNKRLEGEFAPGKYELGCAGSGNYMDTSIKIGLWHRWNKVGSKMEETHFEPNQNREENLHGLHKEWYPNGVLKTLGLYKHSMKTGKWEYQYESGVQKAVEQYLYKDCGLLDYVWFECPTGIWKTWDEDGNILRKIRYIDGVPVNKTEVDLPIKGIPVKKITNSSGLRSLRIPYNCWSEA